MGNGQTDDDNWKKLIIFVGQHLARYSKPLTILLLTKNSDNYEQ